MGQYFARRADGEPVIFNIKGEAPSQTESQRISAFLASPDPFGQNKPPEKEKEEAPGIATVAGRSVARGWNEVQAGVDTALQSIFEGTGNTGAAKEWKEAAEAQRAERDTYKIPEGGLLNEIVAGVGGSVPSMAAGVATGYGGAQAGAAIGSVFGPAGTVGGAVVGGLLGAGAAYIPQMLNANAERQIEEKGYVSDWGKAYAGAAIGAGVEGIGDRLGLKVVGALADGARIAGKAIPTRTAKVVRDSVSKAIPEAATIVMKRVGTGVGLGALTGAAEEVVQQGLERWQAELPLMDEEAQAEYLRSAIVGGISEALFGAGAGAYGAHSQIKTQKELEEAKKDMKAEADGIAAAASRNNPQTEGPTPEIDPAKLDNTVVPGIKDEKALPAGLQDISLGTSDSDIVETELDDKNAPLQQAAASTVQPLKPEPLTAEPLEFAVRPNRPSGELGGSTEERAAERADRRKAIQAKGEADIERRAAERAALLNQQPKSEAEKTVSPPPFSEQEYQSAIPKLRDAGVLSVDKIAKTLGIKKPMAAQYLKTILDRGDAHPAGNKDQYAQITRPHGQDAPKQDNVTGKAKPYRSREFVVKPVKSAGAEKPFSVNVADQHQASFATQEEANSYIAEKVPASKKKTATVVENNVGQQFGVHEVVYENKPGKPSKPINEKVVSTHQTEEEAKAALDGYDPTFSAESNKFRENKTVDQKATEAKVDIDRTLGEETVAKLKQAGTKVLGPGRLELGIAPRIVNPDNPTAIIEGSSEHLQEDNAPGVRKVIGNLIRLSSDIYNPNLTEEERGKRMEEVLNHELVHALRSLDLLTTKEWDTLFQHAASAKVPGKSYTWLQRAMARTGALEKDSKVNPNTIPEEAIAEMVRHYVKDPTAFRNPERGLLRTLAEFIKKMLRLGDRHDAADLIDTIFEGGVADREIGHGKHGMRNADDAFYSLLKTDNFYLGAERFVQGVTREEAPKNDWIKMISTAGIKPEELNWLGIKQWLQDLPKGEMVHKNDVLNFIKASAPQVKPVIFAKSGHPELNEAANMAPRWEDRSQTLHDPTYAEVAFTFPHIEGEPVYYDKGGHMKEKDEKSSDGMRNLGNVLAFARFRDVIENGVRVMFIEEMQSDLHQQGSMKGYYSKSAEARAREIQSKKKVAYSQRERYRQDILTMKDDLWAMHRSPEVTQDQIRAKQQEIIQGEVDYAAAEKEYMNLTEDLEDATARLHIPNAPFKSNWEDYVIRRMIRHAVEHGYGGVSWHGSPESVAETEGYGELTVTQDEKGRNQYSAYGGSAQVSPIVNRYLLKLPRISKGIAEPFGVDVEHNVIQDASGKYRKTAIPQVGAYESGIANDTIPDIAALRDFVNTIKQDHDNSIDEDIYRNDEDRMTAQGIVVKLLLAKQKAIQRRGDFDATAILRSAGLTPLELDLALNWHNNYDFYTGMDDTNKSTVNKGSIAHDNWRMMFNRPMAESFKKDGSQPFFSSVQRASEAVQADPRFDQWFGNGVVTNEDGSPKVVYHYTNADQDFGRFNKLSHFGTAKSAEDRLSGSVGDNLERDLGPYLNPKQRRDFYFESYAKPTGQRIYPVFLNLRRPLHIVDDKSRHNAFAYGFAMEKEGVISREEFHRIMRLRTGGDGNFTQEGEEKALTEIVKAMEKAGYDGFSYINAGEDVGSMSYVALHPTQIKSIFNQGTWDENDPNIMYSSLQARGADLLENNDKFKHWFNGSRVVDEKGDPYLMFHGTSKDVDFNSFKAGRRGVWFTDDPKEASMYAEQNDSQRIVPNPQRGDPWGMKRVNTASRVVPVFLSIKNPYKMTDADYEKLNASGNYARLQGELFDRIRSNRNGYDGIDYGHGIWIAFDPKQIKSALAEEFSTKDKSFKYSSLQQPLYAATAPMGQRVPVNPPIDRLAEVHNRLTYDNLGRSMHWIIEKTMPSTWANWSREKTDDGIIGYQDRMLSWGRLIDRMKKNGGLITNENDVYLRDQLYSSQTDAHLSANERDIYKPMLDTIKGLSVTQRDFDEAKTIDAKVEVLLKEYTAKNHKYALAELYLYARHAHERNIVMRKRNDRLQGAGRHAQYEAGSGMADGTAQAVLDWFDSKSFGREFSDVNNPNSVRSRMRAIIKNTNDISVAAGLTPDFRTMVHADGTPVDPYKDYAPIRGRINEAYNYRPEDDIEDFFAKTGKGFNIRGKEDMSALGRESMGKDLIAHAILQNQERIVRAGKNKVAQAFRQLILDNPAEMHETAEIMSMPRTKYTYDVKRGVVREVVDNRVMDDPTVLKGKLDGQQFYIQMKNKRIVQAMGTKSGLGSGAAMPTFVRGMIRVNRFLAATRTSWNPEFMINNGLKDLEAALVNISEHDASGIRWKIAKSAWPALRGVLKSLRSGDRTSEWAKVYEEFKQYGGHTAVFGLAELPDKIAAIHKEVSIDASGAPTKVLKPIKAIFQFVEDWNLAIENGTRLSAYKTLRDQYLSMTGDPNLPANQKRAKEMAAWAAKNLTVNFNMGGEKKTMMSALYMFFNASMQGSMALINPALRSKRVRRIWAGVIVAGAVQDMVMSMLSPEDDDGESTYDKIPDYVKEHNMIFMDPFGISERGYFKIPMPFLMNGLYNWGRAMSATARGKYTAGEMMTSGMMTMVDSLNPMGGSNSWLNWLAPSIADPIVDLTMNEDFTGKPIAPPVSPYDNVGENRSQQFWNNTNPAYVKIADWLSYLTGREGDYLPGYAEYSPNQVEYMVEWVTGGTGPFLVRAGSLAVGGVTGDLPEMDIEANDIPFIRKFTGQVTSKNDLQDYIEGRDHVMRIRKALKDASKDGDSDTYRSIMQKYPKEYRAAARINAIENARKKLSAKIKKIRENTRYPQAHKDALVKRLKERQDFLVGRGNEVLGVVD